ncbi:hypothetical protein ACFLZL_04580 [Thermodesulfobacteriota bacterium]
MSPFARKIMAISLIVALTLIPFSTSVMAEERNPTAGERTSAKMTADLLLVRPAGIFATLLGGALFIIGSPFSALGGNFGSTYDKLVVAPAKYTFKRPLGDL